MPNNNEGSDTRDAAGSERGTETGNESLQSVKKDLSGAVETVKEQAGAHLEQYKDTAADQIESLAQNAQSVAQQMEGKDRLGLSRYVSDIAGSMTTLADDLRNKNAEQLLQDAARLARDNPVLFLAGSVALGLGLSRLLKASSSSPAPAFSSASIPTSNATSTSHGSQGPHASQGPQGSTAPSYSTGRATQEHDTPISPSTLAAEEMVATHPHDGDVLHSARPGRDIPDRPTGADRTDDLDDDLPGGSSTPRKTP